MAIKAANLYMSQRYERSNAMATIDQALEMLGPIEKVKGNQNIKNSVDNLKKVLETASKKPVVTEADPCDDLINGAFTRLTGQDPFAAGGNPFADGPPKAKVDAKKAP